MAIRKRPVEKQTAQPYDWQEECPYLRYPKAGHVRFITSSNPSKRLPSEDDESSFPVATTTDQE